MNKRFRLSSIENVSLMRKFTVLFIVMSLLPFLIIVLFYMERKAFGSISVNEKTLLTSILLLGPGLMVGFYGMRKSLLEIKKITEESTQKLAKDIPVLAKKINIEESEVVQLTRTFGETIKNMENNIKRLEASKQTMQYVLSKLAVGISSLQNTDTFLDLIVEITANALDAKLGVLMLLDEEKKELFVKSISGFRDDLKDFRIKLGQEGPGWVAENRKPLMVPSLSKEAGKNKNELLTPPFLCAPMIYQDKVIGALCVAEKVTGGNFLEDELLIITNLASQTAIAVENERLHVDAEKTYLETVSALAMAVEARDPYSRGHSDRVSQYSVKIAEKMGLDEEDINNIKDAAELHDIGKIGISDEILKKAGALNESEAGVMHKHPIIGEGIVKPVRSLSRLCSIIRHHHEWIDGSGYPDGLKGEQISLEAKILAVADTFDAMTTNRPYRAGLSFQAAKEEIKLLSEIHYDKKVVEAFLSAI